MPRMLMCVCTSGARRLNTSSAWSPGAKSIAAWRRWVFQAMTMFASKVRAPEMAPSCSVVRPCFAGIMPLWMARCRLWTASPWLSRSRISVWNTGQIEDFRPEYRVAEVIAEIEGAQQLSQSVTGFVNGIAGGGRAEAVERLGRWVPAVLDGGSEPEQAIPTPADRAAGNGLGHDWPQDLRDCEPLRQIEPSLFQPGQSRAQIELHHLGERHRKMREAMGVDRDALELIDLPLAQRAFDGGARLPAVQDDRLIIKNAPLVEHMGIGSDRIGSPSRVEPGRPEIAR